MKMSYGSEELFTEFQNDKIHKCYLFNEKPYCSTSYVYQGTERYGHDLIN